MHISRELLEKYGSLACTTTTGASSFITALKRTEAKFFERAQGEYLCQIGIFLQSSVISEVIQLIELSPEVIRLEWGSCACSEAQLEAVHKRRGEMRRMGLTLSLQQVGVQSHLASDFCPALGKLFKLKNRAKLAIWCATSANTGEIATMVLVPSEAFQHIKKACTDLSARDNFTCLVLFTDDQPTNHQHFEVTLGKSKGTLVQATDLRHYLGRGIERLHKFSPHFSPLCARLSNMFLQLDGAMISHIIDMVRIENGMPEGATIMRARDEEGKAVMKTFAKDDYLTTEEALEMCGLDTFCPNCKEGNSYLAFFTGGGFTNPHVRCSKCDYVVHLKTDLKKDCPLLTSFGGNIQKLRVDPAKSLHELDLLILDLQGKGREGTNFGIHRKTHTSNPEFVASNEAVKAFMNMRSKIEYVAPPQLLAITRYRPKPKLDSKKMTVWVSLEETTGTEGRFGQFESTHAASTYGPQKLSDQMLEEADVMNTVSRRTNCDENNLVHVDLLLGRSNNELAVRLGLPPVHPWLAPLRADTGERFLYDYFREASWMPRSTEACSSSSIGSGGGGGSSSSSAVPCGADQDPLMAPLVVEFTRPAPPSLPMVRQMGKEARQTFAASITFNDRERFDALLGTCQVSGTPEEMDKLFTNFKMKTHVTQMKKNKGVDLCPRGNSCWHEREAREGRRDFKTQPRLHRSECMYQKLKILQDKIGLKAPAR